MSLNAASVELGNALKKVRLRWEATEQHWRDAVRQDFEARYWAPLLQQTQATLQAMDQLAPVLLAVRRDCG